MIDFKGLLTGGNENLGVEFKQWMDIWDSKEARADIAMHLAAIANYGGGFLIFGVDKRCTPLEQNPDYAAERYNQDVISGIIRRHLHPEFQCLVHMHVHENGVTYPVVEVPSHKSMPIYSTRDAPNLRDNPSALRQYTIYIRDVGPQSVPIRKMEHWQEIAERCIQNRVEVRERLQQEISQQQIDTMTKAITQSVLDAVLPTLQGLLPVSGASSLFPPLPPARDEQSLSLLRKLTEATRRDFVEQVRNTKFAEGFDPREKAVLLAIAENHVAMGYGLLDAGGSLVRLERPMSLLRSVSGRMSQYANHGWHDFVTLDSPEAAPRSRVWAIEDRDYPGVEGMRNDDRTFFFGTLDYWRAYRSGAFTISKSYREDYQALRLRVGHPHISTTQFIMRMHAVLAHAAFTSRAVEGVDRILIHMDWHGMEGRFLTYGNGHSLVSRSPAMSRRISEDLTVSAEDLRTDYFNALKRLCGTVLDIFDGADHVDFDAWFTRSRVLDEFNKFNSESGRVRLVEDLDAAPQAEAPVKE